MTEQIDGTTRCTIEGSRGTSSFRLTVSAGDAFQGGQLARLENGAALEVTGTGEVAKSHQSAALLAAVGSGSRYAFRVLKLPLQRLLVRELVGRLGEWDLEGLALGTCVAVSKLANRELPALETHGWEFRPHLITEFPANVNETSPGQEKQIA
jgi:hypothetical protein